jgi:sugar/nucleoside kinase (ribokinase family)
LGDRGALYLDKKTKVLVPTDPVKPEDIVDSVGSGDIFSASFAYKYFLTKQIKESIVFANTVARQGLFYPADALKFTITP